MVSFANNTHFYLHKGHLGATEAPILCHYAATETQKMDLMIFLWYHSWYEKDASPSMLFTLVINDATTQRDQTKAGEATLEHRHFNQGGILMREYDIYNYLFVCNVLSHH